jgi:rubrerythrin
MKIYSQNANLQSIANYQLAENTRADIIGEFEAINQYERHIEQSNNPIVNKTLTDIVNEEKHHVGQLMGLLFYLDPEAQTQFEAGMSEFMQDKSE